ncbi:MAG: WYL domain-containing protein [Firmicutes bacterium]|nr:WYL domain-containing protein [Bacillota bacterium]
MERLGRILSLLETHPEGLTVEELSKLCVVSTEVIASDLKKLEDWGVPLYDLDEKGLSGLPKAQRHGYIRWALVQDGETRLWPPLRFTDREARAFLDIAAGVQDPVLASAMKKAYQALHPPGMSGGAGFAGPTGPDHDPGSSATVSTSSWMGEENRYRVIKGLRTFYESHAIETYVHMFEDAARLARHVQVLYRPKNVGSASVSRCTVFSVVVEPLCVVLENERGVWYLVGRYIERRSQPLPGVVDGQIIILSTDRTDRVEILSTSFRRPNFNMEDYFAPAWGIGVDEEPVAVCVRFYDDFNVIEKVANRAASRREARLERESNTTYIYADVVAGLDEFRRWLRSFGSSAEVLDPPELRLVMRKTAEALLSLYEGRGRPWDATS